MTFFEHLPSLQSDRILLRALREEDAGDVFAFTSDPLITEFLSWDPHPDQDTTLGFILSVLRRYQSGQPAQWAIVLKESQTVVGISGFVDYAPEHHRGEIAFIMSRACQGKGIMTEANRMILKAGFEMLGLHRVQAKAELDNYASQKTLEKTGMKKEGALRDFLLVKGRYRTYLYYSILREEFNP